MTHNSEMGSLADAVVVRADVPDHYDIPESESFTNKPKTTETPASLRQLGLDKYSFNLLKAIVNEPGHKSGDYIKPSFVPSRNARQCRERLAALQLIEIKPFNHGRGGTALRLVPTQRGKEVLNQLTNSKGE